MRSLKLLLKRIATFSLKMVLVAIPAVVSSYCSYRAAVQASMENYRELTKLADNTAMLLDRQGHVLERMRGEIDVLRMLAAARTGAGFQALPFSEPQVSDSLEHTLKAPGPSNKALVSVKHLTTP